MKAMGGNPLRFSPKINLDTFALSYKDESRRLTIDSFLSRAYPFSKIKSNLNFGLTWSYYWLKFNLTNQSDKPIEYLLVFESIIHDTLTFYQCQDGLLTKSQSMGEGVEPSQVKTNNTKPEFQILLPPKSSYTYYIKASMIGQPVNLSGKLLSHSAYENWNYSNLFFIGAIYGIIFLILLLNVSFFITTKEILYINFSLQVLASWLCLFYFDGYISKYIFPYNLYWANQSIAIFMSLTFVFSNLSVAEYFNFNKLAPIEDKVTKALTYAILVLLAISFYHPIGFFVFIICMIFVTSFVALLLLRSVIMVKNRGFTAYFYGFIATLNLILFGSMFQLYISGTLPCTFISQHAMHFAVVGQALFMALAVNDKFKHIKEENSRYQEQLLKAVNDYAQNLTITIESERQRLANDLHDSLGQNLLSIRNKILLIKKRKQVAPEVEMEFDILSQAISGTLEEVRSISYNLRPPILNTLGLTAAINSLVENIRSGSDLEISLYFYRSIDGLIKKDLEINVYRILQECFNNAIKHARATKIELNIAISHELNFHFKDNGQGFNTKFEHKGHGLLGIKERVALMGGSLNITSDHKTGTQFFFTIPVNQQ